MSAAHSPHVSCFASKYNIFLVMLGRALAVRIEKDYNNMRMNLSSQREKAEESYRREFERLMNRKGDLDKQLRDMEKKMEVSQSASRQADIMHHTAIL
jgi:hypothetical protein